MPNALLVTIPGGSHQVVPGNCLADQAAAFIQAGKPANHAAWAACAYPGRRVRGIPARTVTPRTVQLAGHHRPARARLPQNRWQARLSEPKTLLSQPPTFSRALRPGRRGPLLAAQVGSWLGQWWLPQQISRRLRIEFPGDPMMRVSHETIYQALYVQGRGELRRELARGPGRHPGGQAPPARPREA